MRTLNDRIDFLRSRANGFSRRLRNPLTEFLGKDGRHYQIIYLVLFLSYGLFFLDWEPEIFKFGIAIGACLVFQAIGIALTTRNFTSLKSALISSLSLCLMFKANEWYTIVLAAFLTIGSKYLIRYQKKHIFNPTNFGIIVAILLSGDAWISPGQWGSNAIWLFFIGITGCIVLFRVGRLDTSFSFLLVFAGLQWIRNVWYLGWGMDYFFHQLSSGTLLLFTFFMITDPVTTPNAPKARIIWASLIGILAFGLTNWFYVHTAPIWALFIFSFFTPLFDRIFLHKRFTWLKAPELKPQRSKPQTSDALHLQPRKAVSPNYKIINVDLQANQN